MAALDVLIMGEVSARQVAGAADAFSDFGRVYLLPAAHAVVQDEGEAVGVLAHHFRIHLPAAGAGAALDAVHAYHELVIPEAFIVAELASVAVMIL